MHASSPPQLGEEIKQKPKSGEPCFPLCRILREQETVTTYAARPPHQILIQQQLTNIRASHNLPITNPQSTNKYDLQCFP